MWAARADDGFLFGGLTPACVETLRGVPMLIESTDERVRQRLLPDAYTDAHDAAQWREHAVPELERLFLSRAQLVRRDLAALRKIKDLDSFVLVIPDPHVNAWLSSLNAARLALYVLNDLAPAHLERDGHRDASHKQQEALLRIHFLAELQSVLLGDVDFDDDDLCPPSFDGDGDGYGGPG